MREKESYDVTDLVLAVHVPVADIRRVEGMGGSQPLPDNRRASAAIFSFRDSGMAGIRGSGQVNLFRIDDHLTVKC